MSLPAPTAARLRVHGVGGRQVATIDGGARDAGDHVLTWDGNDDHGADVCWPGQRAKAKAQAS